MTQVKPLARDVRPAIEAGEIRIKTFLERRPGVECAVQRREDCAAILMAWHEFRSPLFVAPALEFVQAHERFRAAELPSLRDESSRLVLVRRLVREGFLRVSVDQVSPTRASVPRTGNVAESKGSLVIAGSGIKSLAHMTLEAKGWLDCADEIFYLLSDPASEVWMLKNYPASTDLSRLYSEHYQRSDVYDAMVEAMLRPVREGKLVVGIYYGHPGVFATPTHNAVRTARAQGFSARMLPGVSASDCIYADVGFDPSDAGSQFYEATDLLVYRRPLHPECNVIIWQIGVVGNPTTIEDASKLPILVDYLCTFYDPACLVAHYQGSVFSVCEPVIEWLPLRELGKGARVTTMSTLFIPPQRKPEIDRKMAARLGLVPESAPADQEEMRLGPALRRYKETPRRSALADFILAAATEPELLRRFEGDPGSVACATPLSEEERGALLTRMPQRIWAAIEHASTVEK